MDSPENECAIAERGGGKEDFSFSLSFFQQHADVLLASLMRPPITHCLSTGKSPGAKLPSVILDHLFLI